MNKRETFNEQNDRKWSETEIHTICDIKKVFMSSTGALTFNYSIWLVQIKDNVYCV